MKLHELCDKMEIGNIRVCERENPNTYAFFKFSVPARSPLKKDYYYAEVEYFTVRDNTIHVIVKRSSNNG